VVEFPVVNRASPCDLEKKIHLQHHQSAQPRTITVFRLQIRRKRLSHMLEGSQIRKSGISKCVCCHHKNDVIQIQNLECKRVICLFTCKLGTVSRLLGINGQDPSVSKSTGYMLTSLGFSFNKFKVYFLDSFNPIDNFPEVINFNR